MSPRGLALGNRVIIGPDCFIDAQGGVLIADGTIVEAKVQLLTTETSDDVRKSARNHAPIEIGAGAVIERAATLLPGARIGAGSIVSAGMVIDCEIPPNQRARPAAPSILQTDRVDHNADALGDLPNGRKKHPNITFVVTTGRSGSTTAAESLNAHPQISARHEPRMQFIAWATQAASGELTSNELRRRMESVFLEASVWDPKLSYVESDQKYSTLIPELHAVLPEAKFIWLTRPAEAVVASAYARGWYRETEEGKFRTDDEYWMWQDYRLNGPVAGDLTDEEWDAMDSFARNCWYWSYINRKIEKDLSSISANKWMWCDIGEFESRRDQVMQFLGVSEHTFQVQQHNASDYGRYLPEDWTSQQRADFDDHCSSIMRRIYQDRAYG